MNSSPVTSASHTATWTENEIRQQPECWRQVLAQVERRYDEIQNFLAPLLAQVDLQIILTGAGTSAFIGETIAPWLAKHTVVQVRAIASTDLVSNPQAYLSARQPLLLVSFARSGNSPESMAAVQLANQCVTHCYHLVITCNADGQLQQLASRQPRTLSLLMPPQTDDRGFAMTSSASSMMISCLAVLAPAHFTAHSVADVVQRAQSIITTCNDFHHSPFGDITCERVVYLGSGVLSGLAREAALKVLELTAGRLAAFYDSPLSFRHGPKSIVNADTLVVLFVSADPYTRQYDLDLLAELRRDQQALRVVALAQQAADIIEAGPHCYLPGSREFNDAELAFCYLIYAQIFALSQSLKAGITPDNPSASGTVNRIVKGVTIYPYQALN